MTQSTTPINSTCAVKEIIVYAPCEMLRGQIQWIEAAGCDDSDTLKIRQRGCWDAGMSANGDPSTGYTLQHIVLCL